MKSYQIMGQTMLGWTMYQTKADVLHPKRCQRSKISLESLAGSNFECTWKKSSHWPEVADHLRSSRSAHLPGRTTRRRRGGTLRTG